MPATRLNSATRCAKKACRRSASASTSRGARWWRKTKADKEETLETSERRNKAGRTGAELEERTLKFAVQIVAFVGALPRSDAGAVIGKQLLRSETSIGANYREANRGESPDDFAYKVAVAVKEAAERSEEHTSEI